METISLGKEEALRRYASEWWVGKSSHEIALTQLQIAELICPMSIFHKAMQAALGYPVWINELGDRGRLDSWFEELTKGDNT